MPDGPHRRAGLGRDALDGHLGRRVVLEQRSDRVQEAHPPLVHREIHEVLARLDGRWRGLR